MASTSDFRNGLTLDMDNGLYTIANGQYIPALEESMMSN